jgi:hypothetical protein
MSEAIVALALMKEAIQPNKGGHRSSAIISRASLGLPSSAVISRHKQSSAAPEPRLGQLAHLLAISMQSACNQHAISMQSAAPEPRLGQLAHLQRPITRRVEHLKELLEALDAAVLQLRTRDAHHAPLWKQL